MFCTSCGKNIRDDAKFCPCCGAAVNTGAAAEPQQAPTEPLVQANRPAEPVQAVPVQTAAPIQTAAPVQAAAPVQQAVPVQDYAYTGAAVNAPNKRRGAGALVVVAVAAVAVIAGVVLLAGSLFGGPKAKIRKAAVKSVEAYGDMVDALGIPTAAKLTESRECSLKYSLELDSLNPDEFYLYGLDAQDLEGLGVRMETAVSQKKQEAGASFTAYYGAADIISGMAGIKGTTVTGYIPELMDGTALGLDTATLGKDLDKLDEYGDLRDEIGDLSFNIFDIMDAYDKPVLLDKAAVKAFYKAVEVKKAGSETIDVNDYNVKCTAYHVVIPEDAMKDLLDAMKESVKAQDYAQVTLDLMEEAGLPKDTIAETKSAIKNAFDYDEVFRSLKELVREMGDLELDVYLKGGYIMAVCYDNGGAEVHVHLGGGKNYADDFSVEVTAYGETVRLVSSGNHSGKSGVYTDETVISSDSSWNSFSVKSELEYRPKESGKNFSWSIRSTDASVNMEGQLKTGKDSVDLQLDELSVKAYGSQLFSLKAGCTVSSYSAVKVSADETLMIGNLSTGDLEDLGEKINEEAEDWVGDLDGTVQMILMYLL